MLVVMIASFYIVRILLMRLGVLDYGIFSLVAGLVTMFLFISNSMSSSCQRFFAIELGNKNYEKLNLLWNISLIIFLIIAIFIIVVSETFGVWFLGNYLDIPVERYNAAYWVFQFSIFSLIFSLFSIPFNAILIAREKMNIYAIISLVDISLKLCIVFLIDVFQYDNLIVYSFLLFATSVVAFFIYLITCVKNFRECRLNYKIEKKPFFEILKYSGWNLLGSFSVVSKIQGTNILLNIFFGPIMNASYAISIQLNSAISTFTNNLYSAVRPQIIKNYKNDFESTVILAIKSAKYSYFLIFLISLPILLETDYIFSLWLNETPSKAVVFSRFIIINSILEVINYPLVTMIQATGNIKKYQLIVSTILLLNLPISFVLLNLDFSPETTFFVMITLTLISFIPRLVLARDIAKLPMKRFLLSVVKPIIIVTLTSLILPLIFRLSFSSGFLRFFLVSGTCFSSTIFVIYFLGLGDEDKIYFKTILINKTNEFYKKIKK
jgi:O-antigen/teichoic acid export membrane protein